MQDTEFSDGTAAEGQEASWLRRISETERKEERLLDLRLEGDITAEWFRAKGDALREDFERDGEALLEYHSRLGPEDLDGLTTEQRRDLYWMMRLKFQARDGKLIAAEWGCNDATTRPGNARIPGR